MIKIAYSILLCLISTISFSQQSFVDSLRNSFLSSPNDTVKLQSAGSLADHYTEIKPDSAYYFAEQELVLAQKLGYKLSEVYALQQMGYAQMNLGDFTHSLQRLLSGIAIANDPASEAKILPDKYAYGEDLYVTANTPNLKRLDKIGRMHLYVGILYGNAGNFEKEKTHYLECKKIAQSTGNVLLQSYCNGTLGRSYLYLKMPDSALAIIQTAYEQSNQVGYRKYQGSILLNLARVYDTLKKEQEAIAYFRKALAVSQEFGYLRGVVAANISLADHLLKAGNKDSALYFINQATNTALVLNAPSLVLRSYTARADYYRNPYNSDSLAKYQDLIIPIKNKLFDTRQQQLFQTIDFDEQQRQQQLEAADKAYQNKIKMYGLLTGLGIISIIVGFLWRNNQQKQKALGELKKQKEETDFQRAQAEKALSELKSTQTHWCSAKNGLLGELTGSPTKFRIH
jgi:tetratricopeptide (TPR) repeat protein